MSLMSLSELFECSKKNIERKIKECKEAFQDKLGREPTEKEIESWLIND